MTRAINAIAAAHGALAVVLFVALTVVVSLQVFARWVLPISIIWSEEAARFLFLWVVMLGAALSVRSRRHFVIDVTGGRRPEGRLARILFDLVPDVVVLAFSLLLLVEGIGYTRVGSFRIGSNSAINMAFVYAAIPTFAALSMIYAAENLARDIADFRARRHRPADAPQTEV